MGGENADDAIASGEAKQALVMTPQLQQAIKLLQMTNLDIQNFLQDQALENPFVEVEGGPSEKMAADLGPATETAPHDTPTALTAETGLDRDIAAGSALGDDPTAHSDMENRFGSQGLDFGHAQRGRPADTDWDALANLAETALKASLNLLSGRLI